MTKDTPTAQYKEKFIAYVDILGFKALVHQSELDPENPETGLDKINKLLGLLGSSLQRDQYEQCGHSVCPDAKWIERHVDLRVTQISDCVVVSTEASPAGVISLIHHCFTASIKLLGEGIMCRGYITRGSVSHTDANIIGSAYNKAVSGEANVGAFKQHADEQGTPYIEIDPLVVSYIKNDTDPCVLMMFERITKTAGTSSVIYPFKRLGHSFTITGHGEQFNADTEKEDNQQWRELLHGYQQAIMSRIVPGHKDAVSKANHYIRALDEQLAQCDRTDEMIDRLVRPVNPDA